MAASATLVEISSLCIYLGVSCHVALMLNVSNMCKQALSYSADLICVRHGAFHGNSLISAWPVAAWHLRQMDVPCRRRTRWSRS